MQCNNENNENATQVCMFTITIMIDPLSCFFKSFQMKTEKSSYNLVNTDLNNNNISIAGYHNMN